MLSSNVEYLSTRLYNSSIVAGGSRDSEWKNGMPAQSSSGNFEGSHPYYMNQIVG